VIERGDVIIILWSVFGEFPVLGWAVVVILGKDKEILSSSL
jgi:hypothetical protein